MLCSILPALLLLAGLSGQTEQAGILGTIEGVVTGPGDKAVPLADVWVVVNGKEVARIKADGSGYFTFHRLPLGPVTVHGTREGRTLGQATAMLAQAQAHARVRIRVLAGGAIRGRVLDPAGEPIRGAHVVVSPTVSTADTFDVTDDQGRFTLMHIPLGRAQLWVVARGFDTEEQPCEVPDDMEQTFRLERADDERVYQDLGKMLLEQVTIRPYRSSDGRRNGIQVLRIDADLGKRIGLRNGDVILQINGVPVLTRAQVLQTVASFRSRGILAFRLRLVTMGRIESRVYPAPAR